MLFDRVAKPMFVSSKRLSIDLLKASHADELTELLDPRVNACFLEEDKPADKEALREQYRAMEEAAGSRSHGSRFMALTVRLAEDNRAIGRIEALVHGEDAEIAFLFVASSWGNGFATEAVEIVASKLKEAQVERLWACVSPDNSRSLALCKRLSFQPCPLPTTFEPATFDEGDEILSVRL